MLDKRQEQVASDGGSAIQAGRDITILSGVSYSEVRQVALDVFSANFQSLVGEAKEVAQARAEEITKAFLSKLEQDYPAGLARARDPDFQHALFTVQKEHARFGDHELGDLLVDLLVDRTKQEDRSLLQIVLNESLNTAPKLTEGQLAVLALSFLFRHTQNLTVSSHNSLGNYLDAHVAPFAPKLVKNEASFQHLQFTGCGSIGLGVAELSSILGSTYKGLFSKGLDAGEIRSKGLSEEAIKLLFVPCMNAPSRLQVAARNDEMLAKLLEDQGIQTEERKTICSIFGQEQMSSSEIEEKCIEIRPYMKEVFEMWSGSPMGRFSLTSVGMAIGHANIKRLVGDFASLAIWIN